MNDQTDLEHLLRATLEKKDPSADFTGRVLARAEQGSPMRWRSQWRSWAAGCIAASLLMGTLSVREMQQRRERERGRAAREQLVQALAITSHTLQRIQKKLDGLNHD